MRDHAPPTILVATDFTPASRAAFDSGVKMAKEEGGRLVLVHALRPDCPNTSDLNGIIDRIREVPGTQATRSRLILKEHG
ncbi:MAG TPA: universal stress protein [Candidatus Thermoplasmatota archaeon]|nr:universal stress protein [Candidatus Thermoplasmatota archaeon]